MASFLLTFFDDLEAMTVSYTDKNGATATANCLNIDEKADSIQTAHLPCRILTSTQPDTAIIHKGAGIMATWNITDLFLLDTVARDISPHIQMPVLKRYEAAYLEALFKKWNLPHQYSTEELTLSCSLLAGKFEYPSGGGVFFYGVKCDVVMEEIF